ncbi:phenylalanine--tRNA ligase subunit beta [Brachybacterium sp. EF45031]|uniref:phenylalanine--tRNA ligase subunit beta n=1 Tax=Brachybacterium sillae TaxID=2810536 RepID=UPI00217E7455|nr:phenylalanine--tRNA ligase subunit beta [Brachybacterium sillae]MCS6711106.1 phenylalanine--tRNA ligase subunit beta [Brachybacterium sillae]
MPRIPLTWLAEHVQLREGADTAAGVAADLVSVGLEEEAIHPAQVTGPLVVGRVLNLVKEPQKNGKTINWCRVDVGPEHNEAADDPKDPQPGEEVPSRGIICGAHNFVEGDLVIVSLPGTVLPGPFPIAGRKTYGHFSDGMICSGDELGLGPDPAGEDGIIVLGRGHGAGLEGAKPGDDAIALLGLGDEVVEINVTPDRGYCFAMRGVAREYSHATGQPYTDPVSQIQPMEATDGGSIPVQIDDPAPIHGAPGCSRFVAMEIHGVDPQAASPQWMRQRLTLAGMRPISLIVDVTNYVMLDLGQPLHAYDAEKLVGPILVRRAQQGETLETLDGTTRTLHPEDLLITDFGGEDGAGRVIGMAGVMGGASTEVSDTTRNIVLEAATFDPVTVARTARRHRLHSEASKRFERGVDPALPEYAVQRAAELIVQFGGGTIDARRTVVGEVPAPDTIDFPLADAERVIGLAYTEQQVREPLAMIGCTVEDAEEGLVRVTPPTWRPDLTIREDLVEEIARLNGYAAIPSIVPRAPAGTGLTRAQRGRRAVSLALVEAGSTEVASMPFIGEGVFDQLGYAPEDDRRAAVRLVNPLAEDEPLMRTALLQTLLPTARRNFSRGAETVAIHEIATAHTMADGQGGRVSGVSPVPSAAQRPSDAELDAVRAGLPRESRRLAAVLAGPIAGRGGDLGEWGWEDALDLVQRAAAAAGTRIEVRQTQIAPLHPGRAAEIRSEDGTVLGLAGELHPAVVKAFDLPQRAAVLELDVDALIASAPLIVPAEPVSTFPPAKEDFAFVVDQSVPASAVEAAIIVGIGDLLEDVQLFDVFTGEQVGEGRKSLAYAVRLRSQEGTLTADQIGAARERCVTSVKQAVGGDLRA